MLWHAGLAVCSLFWVASAPSAALLTPHSGISSIAQVAPTAGSLQHCSAHAGGGLTLVSHTYKLIVMHTVSLEVGLTIRLNLWHAGLAVGCLFV